MPTDADFIDTTCDRQQESLAGHLWLLFDKERFEFRSGEIIAAINDEHVLVEVFRSADVCTGPRRIIPLRTLMRCQFYATWQELSEAHNVAMQAMLRAFVAAAARE